MEKTTVAEFTRAAPGCDFNRHWSRRKVKRTCPCCGLDRVGPVKTWVRMTSYQDDTSNHMRCCVHCIREDDAYWREMWQEYYAGQGYPQRVDLPVRNGRRPTIIPARYRR